MDKNQLKELLLQSFEHEMGGVQIYETAVDLAVNEDLKKEWKKYLKETQRHVTILDRTLTTLGIDPAEETPGREVVRSIGESLVAAMAKASAAGDPAAAELVACECVSLAETKDHLDWELIGEASKKLTGDAAKALKAAYDEVEDQEDEHLYHTKGWCRELWIQSLGMRAVLPPPEERKHVKTAIGAARAEQARTEMR